MAAHASEPAGSNAEPAAQRQADRLHCMVMDALRQRIAARQSRRKAFRKGLDDTDFQRKTTVDDVSGEGS